MENPYEAAPWGQIRGLNAAQVRDLAMSQLLMAESDAVSTPSDRYQVARGGGAVMTLDPARFIQGISMDGSRSQSRMIISHSSTFLVITAQLLVVTSDLFVFPMN